MKRIIIAIFAVAVCSAACAGETSNTLKAKELTAEYTRLQQQVAEGQAQLLRLEGAIRILQLMDSETSSTATTTHTAISKK